MKTRGTLVLFLVLLTTLGCHQDEISVTFAPSNSPAGSLAPGGALSTTNRQVQLQLNSPNSVEYAVFVNQTCDPKAVTSWEPITATRNMMLPDADGRYVVSVVYRDSNHFTSECQNLEFILDRQGPILPGAITLSKTVSNLVESPLFSWTASTDAMSGVKSYEARLLNAGSGATMVNWTDMGTNMTNQKFSGLTLSEGSLYQIEVRAYDNAGNVSSPRRSPTFSAGPFLKTLVDKDYDDSGVYTITFMLSAIAAQNITLKYHTEAFTALPGLDYVDKSGTLTFLTGQNSVSFLVNIKRNFQPGSRRKFKVIVDSIDKAALSNSEMLVGVPITTGSSTTPPPQGNVTPAFTQLAGGYDVMCGLTAAGDVYCWGSNASAQLGQPSTITESSYALKVNLGGPATKIATKSKTICVLMADTTVKCWGANDYGQMGTGVVSTRVFTPTTVPSLSNVVDLAVAESSVCVVTSPGDIYCWGKGQYGQIGTADQSDRTTPVSFSPFIGGANHGTNIMAENNAYCVRLQTWDGFMYCWGNNINNQLGVSNATTPWSATPLGVKMMTNGVNFSMEPVQMSGGTSHFCFRTLSNLSGPLYCWGDYTYIQSASTAATSYVGPTPSLYNATTKGVYTGGDSTCAIYDVLTPPASFVPTLACWGRNQYGQLGTADSFGGTQSVTTAVSTAGLSLQPVMALAPTGQACVVLTSGETKCWGQKTTAQATAAAVAAASAPQDPSFLGTSIQNLKSILGLNCVTDPTGLLCWGDNGYSNVNFLNPAVTPTATVKLRGTDATDFALGRQHVCILLTSGTILCKGNNTYGQLGNGTLIDSPNTFVVVSNLTEGAVAIAAGDYHTCAILTTGGIRCWGKNDRGQLGLNNADPYRSTPDDFEYQTPEQVSAGSLTLGGSYSSISAAGNSSCAVANDGRVYCWGANNSSGTFISTYMVGLTTYANPSYVGFGLYRSGADQSKKVFMSRESACVLSITGVLSCWGLNNHGQLGNGNMVNQAAPVAVTGLTNISSAALSTLHGCAADTAGKVYCWGSNQSGAIGDPNVTGDTLSPVPVPYIEGGATAVSAGEPAAGTGPWTCAFIRLGTEGSVKCWGGAQSLTTLEPYSIRLPPP